MSKYTKAEQAASVATLLELCPVGSTVYTTLRHVSKSGMSRHISAHVVTDGAIRDITQHVARAVGFNLAPDSSPYYALRVGGCGMDMGFHVVYSLASVLYRGGHRCTGSTGRTPTGKPSKAPRCPSNDHSNDYGDLSRKFDAAHPDAPSRYGDTPASQAEIEHYVAARQSWIAAQPTYSKTRMHRDGGYALNQSWV